VTVDDCCCDGRRPNAENGRSVQHVEDNVFVCHGWKVAVAVLVYWSPVNRSVTRLQRAF